MGARPDSSAPENCPSETSDIENISQGVGDNDDSSGLEFTGTAQLSSFEVFMTFVDKTSENTINVDRVFSKECYKLWLDSRSKTPKQPKESFRRALTSHVRGTDQRK